MAVATDATILTPYHQTRLAVRLITDQPVHHMSANLFERPCPGNIGFLIKTGSEFDQDGHFFTRFCGPRECLGNGRGRTDPVESHFNGQDIWVGRGLFHKARHYLERLVGVMHQDVALPDRTPHIRFFLTGRDRQGCPGLVFMLW